MLHKPPGLRVLALLVASSACAQTLTHPLSDMDRNLIQSELEGGRKAKVTLAPTAAPAGATAVAAAGRSRVLSGTTYLQAGMVRVVQQQQEQLIPLGDVQELNTNRAGRGAFVGLGVGILVAGVVGYALSGGNCPDDADAKLDDCLTDSEAGTMGALVLAPVGALVGLAIGALAGSGPVWKFQPASTSSESDR